MIVFLAACGSPQPAAPPEPKSEAPADAVVHAPVPESSTPGEGTTGGAVPVELQFVGVGGLHRRYFADDEILVALSEDLGACVRDRAVVRVEYDNETRIGRIRALQDAKQLTCKPSRKDKAVDVSTLEPLGRALARYRDTIAGRFDFRISSFKIELEAVAGTNGCTLTLGGQFPPDGSTWANCPTLGGEKKCDDDEHEGRRVFTFSDEADARYLVQCLGG